jgi:hypothetical protein
MNLETIEKESIISADEEKGLCDECSYYRPLKQVGEYKVCDLCEVYYTDENK